MQTFFFLLLACAAKHEPASPQATAEASPPARPPRVASPAPTPEPVPAAADEHKNDPPQVHAVAQFTAQNGSNITGAAAFSQVGDVVYVSINILGAPAGEHFVRVYDGGNCAANPHGKEEELGTFTVGADGAGHANFILKKVSLAEGSDALLGRPLVVDDGKACGLIAMPS